MPNKTADFYFKRVALLGVAACMVLLLLWAPDAAAWGVPGASEAGSGSGPGGGSHSGGVPAPFGALFLAAGSLLGVRLRLLFRRQKLLATLPFLLSLGLGICFGWIAWEASLILSVLALGVVLDHERQDKPSIFSSLSGFLPLLFGLTAPNFFGISCVLPLMFLCARNRNSRFTNAFGGGILFLILSQEYALSLPFDVLLQNGFAQLTVSSLTAMGFGAVANGSVITGLATEIHVTKVCAGTLILTNTAALVWFLSSLFVPARDRGKTLFGLTLMALFLNLGRIISLCLVGHYFPISHFSVFHDAAGYLTAALTYTFLFVGVWTFAQKRFSPLPARVTHGK